VLSRNANCAPNSDAGNTELLASIREQLQLYPDAMKR
jgi:hypothetical protein